MSQHQGKNLLILGARQMQLPAFKAAKELGLSTIAVDPLKTSIGASVADKFYTCDLADEENIFAIAQKHSVSGILTLAADYPVPTVAKLCQKLGLKGLSERAAMLSTNKAKMRQALREEGVSIPQWREVFNDTEAITAFNEIEGEVIFKPIDSSGGRGVTLIPENANQEDILKALHKAQKFSQVGGAITEEFIGGKEISVEAITINSKTEIVRITDKLTTEAPFFVEIGHSQPSQLSSQEIAAVKKLTIDGITALGIDNSPSHTEIRFSKKNTLYIIEIGARLGGGYITSHLVPLSSGVDLVKAAVQLAIGVTPDLTPKKDRGAAIRFFRPNTGKVTHISGISKAQQVEGVKELVVETKVGEQIHLLQDATARVGYVICEAETPQEAIKNAEIAKNLIKIDTQA